MVSEEFKEKLLGRIKAEREKGNVLTMRGIERYTAFPVEYLGEKRWFAIFRHSEKNEWECVVAEMSGGCGAVEKKTGESLERLLDEWEIDLE